MINYQWQISTFYSYSYFIILVKRHGESSPDYIRHKVIMTLKGHPEHVEG